MSDRRRRPAVIVTRPPADTAELGPWAEKLIKKLRAAGLLPAEKAPEGDTAETESD